VNDTIEELVGEERMRQLSEECFQQNCSNVHILHQQNKRFIGASNYAINGPLVHQLGLLDPDPDPDRPVPDSLINKQQKLRKTLIQTVL
jgi:hypothetical protein